MSINYGILIYDEVAELDFVGPFQVFGASVQIIGGGRLFTIAKTKSPVRCNSGLTVIPHYEFNDHPDIDVLLIPGAQDIETTALNEQLIKWVQKTAARSRYVTAVCTGALILQKAGLLQGKKATTHWQFTELLGKDPGVTVLPDMRYVKDGNVITSQGVSAGIDMALWLIGHIHSPDHSRMVKKVLQYEPAPPYMAEVFDA